MIPPTVPASFASVVAASSCGAAVVDIAAEVCAKAAGAVAVGSVRFAAEGSSAFPSVMGSSRKTESAPGSLLLGDPCCLPTFSVSLPPAIVSRTAQQPDHTEKVPQRMSTSHLFL